jgi:hypothetical protein
MDVNVKKATLPSRDLPPVNKDNQYAYRYRIISEDRNRISAWSPIKLIDAPQVIETEGNVSISGTAITATWSDQNNRPNYDVFVKFDNGPYLYHGTTPIHTYSFMKASGSTTVSVAIQVEGIAVDLISAEGIKLGKTKIFYGTTENQLLVYLEEDKAI